MLLVLLHGLLLVEVPPVFTLVSPGAGLPLHATVSLAPAANATVASLTTFPFPPLLTAVTAALPPLPWP